MVILKSSPQLGCRMTRRSCLVARPTYSPSVRNPIFPLLSVRHAGPSSTSRSSASSSSSSSSPIPSSIFTLSLTRHTPPSPVKIVPYPHTSSNRLSSTLRPRRRSSNPFLQFARRRSVHLLLALSVPLLALLLANEVRVNAMLRSATRLVETARYPSL